MNDALLQEHLLIVCELLKANLYEFHKFNRESGGEVYFTMPRLQVKRMLVSKFFPCQRLDFPFKVFFSLIFAVNHNSNFGGTSLSAQPWAYTL